MTVDQTLPKLSACLIILSCQTTLTDNDSPPEAPEQPGDTVPGLDTSEPGPTDTGSDDSTDTSTPDSGDKDDQDTPCEWGDATPGQSVSMSMEFDGEERSYEVHLPADYDCTPRPVIIGLHGYYGSGSGFEQSTSQMFDRIDELGFIGLFPDGSTMGTTGWKRWVTSFNDIDSHQSEGPDGPTCTEDAYDYGVFENCPDSEHEDACNWGTSCSDDEGFIRAALSHVQTEWTVDPERVFMTGFSQGGQTAQSLGRRMADVLTATSPHHGFAANGYTVGPETPMSLFQVWGRNDRTVDGNDTASSDGMLYEGAEETALIWAEAQGCASTPSDYATEYDGTAGWDCEEYAGCTTGAKVVTCVWDGAHNWGRRGGTHFALESMLTFFMEHPL